MNERFRNSLNRKTARRRITAFSLVFLSVALIGGLVACSTFRTESYSVNLVESDAANVVEDYLEAKKNNDYEAWKSKLWPAEKDTQNFTPSFEKPGDLGVISLSINKVEVSGEETQRMKEMYTGSDLAQSQGWSDKYISENMIVVSSQYTVDYDNTRVPYQEGTLTQDFILIRNDKDSSWLIWDATSPSD